MKKAINRFVYRLSDKTELPLTELCRDFSVSTMGRNEVTVEGVLSIKTYLSDCIILEVCGDLVNVFGRELVLKNYYHGTLCISGRIDKIEFGEGLC